MQTKISLFFLYQIREQEGRIWGGGGSWYQWEGGGGGEMVKEGEYVTNPCTHACKWKNDIC
jgi:hypothetical protein